MYWPKDPLTEYPEFFWWGHRVSQPSSQYSQAPQAVASHALPTLSPTATRSTWSPIATTVPTPSWPGMNGGVGLTGQSPLAACRSVWQTPLYSTLTRASNGPGVGRARSWISRGWPSSGTTAARIVSDMANSSFPLPGAPSGPQGRIAVSRVWQAQGPRERDRCPVVAPPLRPAIPSRPLPSGSPLPAPTAQFLPLGGGSRRQELSCRRRGWRTAVLTWAGIELWAVGAGGGGGRG